MTLLRKLRYIIGAGYINRWVFFAVSSAVVGVLELVGAVLVFWLIGVAVNGTLGAEVPLMSGLTDMVPRTDRSSQLAWLGSAVALFFLLRAFLSFGHSYVQHRVIENAATRMASRLFSGYVRMPYLSHLEQGSSILFRNVHNTVIDVASYGLAPLASIASESMVAVGLAVSLLITSPRMTLLLLIAIIPPVSLMYLLSRRGLNRLGMLVQETAANSVRYSQESMHAIRDIKLLNREGFFVELFQQNRAALARALYLRSFVAEVPRTIIESMFFIGVSLLIASNVIGGRSALATLGLMAYAAFRLMPPLNRIVLGANNLQSGKAAIDIVYGELRRTEDLCRVEPHETRRASFNLRESLQIEGVRFRFDGTDSDILKGLSFSLPAGTSLGIVGPTGSGKSTLIDVIIGLLPPTEGVVLADGEDIQGNRTGWQGQLGVVPQHPFLIEGTIRDNIALGLTPDEVPTEWVRAAAHSAQLGEVLSSLPDGLDTFIGENGIRLSGGQRQRIAIARALLREPNIIILDEATSALDRVTERKIVEAILFQGSDRTVIMVSHRVGSLEVCDQILLLVDGELRGIGKYRELYETDPFFKSLTD